MSHSKKFVKVISPLALAIALAACGGGETSFGAGGGSTGGGGDQIVKANSLVLTASSRQLLSDGLKPVKITAIAKDKNNNAISGAEIIFSVDNDATIETEAASETQAGSIKTVNLTPGKPKNRLLHVTAKSGSISETLDVEVIGTTVSIDGPDSIPRDKEVSFVLKLKDSGNKPISYEEVKLTSSAGNTIKTDSNFQTNAIGEIAFTLLSSSGGSATDTLTATVLGTSFEKNITISGDEFVLDSAKKEVKINTPEKINFFWKKEGQAQANKKITINATRGILSNNTIITDSNGLASFTIKSSTAGETIIKAKSSDGLSTILTREFVAVTPSYIDTQADPTLIPPLGSSTIITKIRDINDNPVKNKVITFRLDDTVAGRLSDSTAVTDSLGRASVSYTAGNSSSAKDGVSINTSVEGYAQLTDEIKLTVGGNALRLTLGHDNLLEKDNVFYTKKFGVIVTDSGGNPVKDQKVSFTITPTKYYKGIMVPIIERGWIRRLSTSCPSEDINNNGKLDNGEDDNRNGSLEPTHDATVTHSGVTDENGRIDIEVIYPKNTALWSEQLISATTIVDGTEFIENTYLDLPVAAADVKDLKASPPNQVSPYGVSASCTDNSGIISTSITATPIDARTKTPVFTIKNGIWYTMRFTDDLGNPVDKSYIITSSKADVEMGPGNKSFRVLDRDASKDDSGFYITLKVGDYSEYLFYNDTPAAGDTEAPTLTLNGDPIVTIEVGDTYKDQGANAIDVVDGVVTVITQGATIDTTIVGATYTIIYTATDSSGNTAQETRTVKVVDTTPPVITLNGNAIVNINVGDTYTDSGATAIDVGDGVITVTTQGATIDTTVAGTHTITYTATDSSGNTAQETRTVNVN